MWTKTLLLTPMSNILLEQNYFTYNRLAVEWSNYRSTAEWDIGRL